MSEEDQTLLVMTAISKTYPGVHALDNVDFSLKKGEIHCLIGENGAGKSTLIKVLTGVDYPDAGTITLGWKRNSGQVSSTRARPGDKYGVSRNQFMYESERS